MKKLLSMILPVVAAASGIAAGDSIFCAQRRQDARRCDRKGGQR